MDFVVDTVVDFLWMMVIANDKVISYLTSVQVQLQLAIGLYLFLA